MKFSIIVVALNPGDKLRQTVESVLSQSCEDYEIVVKDGGSTDGSLESLPEDARIRVYTESDSGIYDAMNQAVKKAQGEYLLFLNCGDVFYDAGVLERALRCAEQERGDAPLVLYGDTYGAKNDVLIAAPAEIDGFACYRNIPCHQSCFYDARLCKEKPYRAEYRIRADYDHFLWCYYRAGARMVYLDGVVASYEGGGYSESRENRKRDKEEHRQITQEYMSPEELGRYRRVMLLTLAPVRSFLAENRLTSGVYHWMKTCFYRHKLRILAGFIIFLAEVFLFMGTGVLGEDAINYHTGEGSWEEEQSAETSVFCQEFVPKYGHLRSFSFLMGKEGVTQPDGAVIVQILDAQDQVLFEETKSFSEIRDGRFTDVTANLELSTRSTYRLVLITEPSSAGEYTTVGVCGREYKLPENRALWSGVDDKASENITEKFSENLMDIQLVMRYHYEDAVPVGKALKVLLLCLVTAFGVMFGLPERPWIRRTAGIVLLLAGPLVLGRQLELLSYKEVMYLPFAMRWNLGIMFGLELAVLLVTHSPRITVALTNLALTFLYSANYFVFVYRCTQLRMTYFAAAGTAAKVLGDYDFTPNDRLAIIWGLLFLFVVYGVQTGRARGSAGRTEVHGRAYYERKLLSYAVSIAMAAGLICFGRYQLLYTDMLQQAGFADEELRGIGQDMIYYVNGYLVGTCIEVKNSRILPPEDYSVRAVEEILQEVSEERELSAQDQENLPHVILIMNESFADLRVLADLELSQENLSFFNSLKENTVRGYVNASVLGGGTANSEFEVFTGCSVAFFPVNYYPYQQALKRPVESVISHMKRYGYTTYSMHPEPAGNWNRTSVYRYYGFDESLWKSDFAGAEVVHSGASDAETYRKVIKLYENRQQGEKLFIFDLTMQNHGGYPGKDAPYEVEETRVKNPALDEYLSLIKISDEAFEDLVHYFETQDERVVICLFGDHQPWVSDLIVETYQTGADVSQERLMDKYKTPFVIWANYDIEEAEGYDISMNYLGGLLERTAGIPLSPYFAYLERLREEYPVITINGYVDGDGNCAGWSSEGDEFPDYRMLQYNYLFDEDTVQWGY
ncbi:MAG: sulfatase-like hydrolase/transferase [Acetatifactor sp.]|nr:sulfatase-like hydrolase/transferase [Acetatifactor sp.]